jgi:hypothetical protein
MAHVKGLVLLSRFEYLEKVQGPAVFRDFLKKIGTEETDFLRQPVDGANLYSESLLTKVDQLLLDDYFNQKQEEFQKLGEWNARNLIDRFFNLYMEDRNPIGFLEQYARLRGLLIGSGVMTIIEKAQNNIHVTIDYGQNIPKSVCLSEQGFIYGAMELCGAKKIKIGETECAASQESMCCKFDIYYVT